MPTARKRRSTKRKGTARRPSPAKKSKTIIGVHNRGTQIFDWVIVYLHRMRDQWKNAALAIILDIDETALVSEGNRRRPIPGVLKIFRTARKLGMSVFFVTARLLDPTADQETRKELHELGYKDFQGLFLMPRSYLKHDNWSCFKHTVRTSIARAGYYPILNMGDQYHDLALLRPFQKNKQRLALLDKLTKEIPKKSYGLMYPPDLCWVAVKMPDTYRG